MQGLWLLSHIALWVILVFQGIILLAALRQIGVILLRMGPRGALNVSVAGGPEIGKPAPALPSEMTGKATPFALTEDKSGTVLVFASPTCGSCSLVPSAVSTLIRVYGEVHFCVLASGDERALAEYQHKFPSGVSLIRDDGKITSSYSITDLPYAVFIDPHGVVRHKGIVNNREHLEDLIIKGLAVCRHRQKRTDQTHESVPA